MNPFLHKSLILPSMKHRNENTFPQVGTHIAEVNINKYTLIGTENANNLKNTFPKGEQQIFTKV